MFYSTSIFLSAGLTAPEAQKATLGMVVSLVLVERAGRKTLMVIGLCVMLLSTIMILVCLVAAVRRHFHLRFCRLNVFQYKLMRFVGSLNLCVL